MQPVLALTTPYEKRLDLTTMIETGKCTRCNSELQLVFVETDVVTLLKTYRYICSRGACDVVFEVIGQVVSHARLDS